MAGGPLVARSEGKPPKLGAKELRVIESHIADREKDGAGKFRSLDRLYQASPDWAKLANGTKVLWRGELDRIEAKWGDSPVAVWSDHRITAKIIAWRDSRAATPRAADEGVKVLLFLLENARLQGLVSENYAKGIPTIYRPEGREEIIWTDDDVRRFTEAACALNRPLATDAIRLGCYTGLRREDLATVADHHVQGDAIVLTAAKKSKGRRRQAMIPIIAPLRELVTELQTRPRAPGVNTLLVNSHGRPWQPASLTQAVSQICKYAEIAEPGDERLGIPAKLKHLHDTRGTFVTHLCRQGVSDEDIADIVAWSPGNVRTIRKRYVDESARTMALAERIGRGPL